MKRITFLRQGELRNTSELPQLLVCASGVISGGVFLGRQELGPTPFIHLDLDQVAELHRRLGEHLEAEGRLCVPSTQKWRDG